tara:strand:- start:20 stop:637 length:618 start_codon:yes stop_codon:yes gene_type:complete
MFNQKRLKFTFIAFLILLVFILFDIFQLQTTQFQSTSKIIEQQNLDKFYITAPRGEIFDANGEKVAETKLEPHLFINMRKITDDNLTDYKQIIKYNFPDLTTREINEIFQSKDILQSVINLSSVEYEVRNNLLINFDAFLIIDLPKRSYIKNELFSHTIGYLGIPNQDDFNNFQNAFGNNQVGKNGLERYYEDTTKIIYLEFQVN